MTVKIPQDVARTIREYMKDGYASVEDVLRAAVNALQQIQEYGDFAPGELEALIEEGEKSIREEGVVDAEEVFADILRKSGPRRSKSA